MSRVGLDEARTAWACSYDGLTEEDQHQCLVDEGGRTRSVDGESALGVLQSPIHERFIETPVVDVRIEMDSAQYRVGIRIL